MDRMIEIQRQSQQQIPHALKRVRDDTSGKRNCNVEGSSNRQKQALRFAQDDCKFEMESGVRKWRIMASVGNTTHRQKVASKF